MIIRGGENIYPKEIEEFIYTHPKVTDVQVIGVPDEQYGEEIMACIILKRGRRVTETGDEGLHRQPYGPAQGAEVHRVCGQFPDERGGKNPKYKMREEAVEKLKLKTRTERKRAMRTTYARTSRWSQWTATRQRPTSPTLLPKLRPFTPSPPRRLWPAKPTPGRLRARKTCSVKQSPLSKCSRKRVRLQRCTARCKQAPFPPPLPPRRG